MALGIGTTVTIVLRLGGLVTESGPTLCDPMDCSPPGSSLHGILQARILDWVAMSFPRPSQVLFRGLIKIKLMYSTVYV